ncbi:MAG: hypothetical protein WC188_04540 [Candidatus Caldatribacteriota bacterium]
MEEQEKEVKENFSKNVINLEEKYNRKQRRIMQSKMAKEEKAKQRVLAMKGNVPITRKEFVGLFQSAQKLRDRLYYVDVLTAAIEKLLIEKNVITEEELGKYIKEESDKAIEFKKIQETPKDYENRLKRCIELNINPNISNIGQQIYEDTEVSIEEKTRLATEYKLEILLKALENKQQLDNTPA